MNQLTPLKTLEIAVKAIEDRKGQQTLALDVRNMTSLTDYFVITQATNERQLEAIVDNVVKEAEKEGIEVKHVEGKQSGSWILVDLVDVIVHIFHYSQRGHYNLERLWQDAPLVDISEWVIEE